MVGPHPTDREDVTEDLTPADEPLDLDEMELESRDTGNGKKAAAGRLRQQAAGALDRATAKLEFRRPTSYVVDSAFLVAERNRALPAPVLVGALASRLVIYVIPFLALMVFAVGVYADLANSEPAQAARDAGMAGLFAQATEESTSSSEGIRVAALLATAFAVLWAADGLAKLLRRLYALVWGTEMSRPRHRWLLPLGVIFTSIAALVFSSIALDSRDWPLTLTFGEALLEIALIGLLWVVVSRALPHHPEAKHWLDFVPGGLLVAIGVVGMKVAMVVYFAPRAVTLNERYGSVATAVVLLTWAYWVGFIVIASADLNAAVFRSRRRRRVTEEIGPAGAQ
jgi:uncharacterized BrkB/YihY/UPF0761 family membrane protein